jgi:hypothetical protein
MTQPTNEARARELWRADHCHMCGVSLEAREPSTCDEACLTDECSTCFGDMFEGHEAGCPVSENIPAP